MTSALPTRHRGSLRLVEDTVHIAAAAEVVWGLTVDVESWPTLTPTMTSVELLDPAPLSIGSRARIKQPGQRAATWTVTAFEPGHLFQWETTVVGVTMVGTHVLDPDAEGCRNTLSLDLRGRGARWLARLVGGRVRKSVVTENQGFKRAAEEASGR